MSKATNSRCISGSGLLRSSTLLKGKRVKAQNKPLHGFNLHSFKRKSRLLTATTHHQSNPPLFFAVLSELTPYVLPILNSLQLVNIDHHWQKINQQKTWKHVPEHLCSEEFGIIPSGSNKERLTSPPEAFSFTHHPFQLCLPLYPTHSSPLSKAAPFLQTLFLTLLLPHIYSSVREWHLNYSRWPAVPERIATLSLSPLLSFTNCWTRSWPALSLL